MNRSFLKYPGGKGRVLPYLSPYFSPADTFVEPFVGSGVVFLNTNYKHYILSDLCADLINTFQAVKDNVAEVVYGCKALFTAANNTENHYYRLRDIFNSTTEPKLKAPLLIYLNRHCFNGLVRYNKAGKFNVPFGSYTKPYLPEAELFYAAEKLQAAKLYCQDFTQTFTMIGKDCMVYCDPPYDPISPTSSFVGFVGNGFGKGEQETLAQCILSCRSKVVASNSDTPFIRQLYKDTMINPIQVQRNIANRSASRVKVGEVVIVKEAV